MKWFPPLVGMLLCVSLTAVYAQSKSERVLRYLGDIRYEEDKPVGTVKFIFQQAILSRSGTGRLSYGELLASQPGFTDADNAGALMAIQVVHRGKSTTIHPEPRTSSSRTRTYSTKQKGATAQFVQPTSSQRASRGKQEPQMVSAQIVNQSPEIENAPEPIGPPDPRRSVDPVRPRPLFDEPTDPNAPRTTGTRDISLPDSATVANTLDQAKEKVTGWRGQLWSNAQPIWEFVMWIFNSIIIFLICLGGLCRYIAKTAAAESRVNRKGRIVVGGWIAGAHQNASGILLIITWIIAIFFLIDAFMWLVYLNLPLWILLIIWFPMLWFAERLTGWIVPNLRGDNLD
jgi:hypothetical protein